MRIVPMTIKDAKQFIALHHRHNRAPLSAIFAIGLEYNEMIVGVATAGRPVARALDDGWTIEVTRTCTTIDCPKGGVSKLYSACRRAAAALGYRKCITYTLQSESGASLRGAGWQQVAFLKPRSGWDCPSRRRGVGTVDRVAKIRWEIVIP